MITSWCLTSKWREIVRRNYLFTSVADPGYLSRIPGSKKHRIPDPDPQHCFSQHVWCFLPQDQDPNAPLKRQRGWRSNNVYHIYVELHVSHIKRSSYSECEALTGSKKNKIKFKYKYQPRYHTEQSATSLYFTEANHSTHMFILGFWKVCKLWTGPLYLRSNPEQVL